MSAEPLPVSVVIAAYNRPAMTARAVRSALGQRPHPPAEVIVVDDCSADDTGAAAAAAGARVVRHAVNQGEGAARNSGVAAATQPWIGILDSDDEWRPGLLAALWPLRGEHVLLAGSALYREPDGHVARYAGLARGRPRVLGSPRALLYPGNVVPASGVLARRDALLDAGGFDTGLRFCADLDLWLRMLERGTGVMSHEVVVDYHLHPGQVTQDSSAAARAHEQVLLAYAQRPWWSATRVEAWRGADAWDELRRAAAERRRADLARQAAAVLRRPVRAAGLAGLLLRRAALRRRLARLPG